MVKLRFMRIGKKNRPYYRLCAVDARRPRGGEYLEMVGFYDPLIIDDEKKIRLNKERIEYWLSMGAQPTEGVYPFLKRAHVTGLNKPRKPKHQRPERARKAAPAAAAHGSGESQAPGSSSPSGRKPKPPKKAKPPKKPKGEAGAAPSA